MLTQFQQTINRLLPHPKTKSLIAVSGGVDSMVLLHLAIQEGLHIGVAHCNYQLREQADQEADLVKHVCLTHAIPFHSITFDTKTEVANSNESLQMVARRLRYEFFEQLKREHKYEYVATAHHADDNLETILLNLTKGTGIRGLLGIAEKKDGFIRPLLFFTKKEVRTFAIKHAIPFFEDASNKRSDYQRNKIRNEVIPVLRDINPEVTKSASKTIENLKFTNSLFNERLEKIKKQLLHSQSGDFVIFKRQLFAQPYPEHLLYEILTDYGFKSHQISTLFSLLSKQKTTPSEVYTSETHQACIDNRSHLLISLRSENHKILLIPNTDTSEYYFGQHVLTVKEIERPNLLKSTENKIFVDASTLTFPLQIRQWKAGDYFYPFGLGKKKKVSKFLINLKVNKIDKSKQFVLTSGEKIVWLVGRRLDDRFAVTENTKKVIEFSLSKNTEN